METKKICPQCNVEKDIAEFGLDKNGVARSYCRKCNSQRVNEYHKKNRKENPMKYYPRSSWASINQRAVNGRYSNNKSVIGNKQHNSYHAKNIKIMLSKDEWFNFWHANEELVLSIVKDGEIPSVDRIDNNKDYELENIRIVPLIQNIRRFNTESSRVYDKEKVREYNRSVYTRTHENARKNNVGG